MIDLARYRNKDPREMPAYTIPEAARYLSISTSTLRSWITGRKYPTRSGTKKALPIIVIPSDQDLQLSYYNLVEAYVLNAICHGHGVPLTKVRDSVQWIGQSIGSPRPLLDHRFKTDGIELYINNLSSLVVTSRGGQLAIREMIESYLNRIDRDSHGIPIRLYPLIHKANEPHLIAIDPGKSFGRPVLYGTGITTSIIADRFKGGEAVETLMADYDISHTQVTSALEYEHCDLAAA